MSQQDFLFAVAHSHGHTFAVAFNEGEEISAIENLASQANDPHNPMTYGIAFDLAELIRGGTVQMDDSCGCDDCVEQQYDEFVVWHGQLKCHHCGYVGCGCVEMEIGEIRPTRPVDCESCGLDGALPAS